MASMLITLIAPLLLIFSGDIAGDGFEIREATIDAIQRAFKEGELTSRQLVEYYSERIHALNPLLRAVIEVNPDAIAQAERADRERIAAGKRFLGGLHGIPILLKDNIATKDRLNTTAGSFALLGSVVPRDAGVVRRLRRAGAIVLGKASLSEWAHFRFLSSSGPNGWCGRSGQGKNPYVLSRDPCGSSSGSAIAVAANMAAVTLGTETAGSIVCPSSFNSVVGIKPTAGLASRAGVIPLSSRQDNIGPMCRTVSDAVRVLDVIVGYDPRDEKATHEAAGFIPQGGYGQFLNADGLRGKRLGILRDFFDPDSSTIEFQAFERHFTTMREKGAMLSDNLEIPNANSIQDFLNANYLKMLQAEFKVSINAYLSELTSSPVRSLSDVIRFNNEHRAQEKIDEYGQDIFLDSQNTNGVGPNETAAIARMSELSKEGLEKLMKENNLDAVVTRGDLFGYIMAFGGYPGIVVPAGYGTGGFPFGLCFAGLKGFEPRLIEIAYSFEQATKVRKPPSFKP